MRTLFKDISLHLPVVLLFVLSLRLSVPLTAVYGVDEGIIATAADKISEGGVFYRDIADPCAPVTPYFYALVFLLWGKNNMVALHLSLTLIVFLSACAVYILSAILEDRKTGFFAALFYCLFSYTYIDFDVLSFETEWLASLFFLAGAILFIRYYQNNRTALPYLAGVFFGLGFFSKQFMLAVYFALFCFGTLLVYIRSRDIRSVMKGAVLNLTGFLTPGIIILSYFYANNSLKAFRFWFWRYHMTYYVPALPFFKKLIGALFLTKDSYLAVNWLLPALFVVYLCWVIVESFRYCSAYKLRNLPVALPMKWFLLMWALSSYFAICYSGRDFGHYYIILIPLLSAVAASSAKHLFELSKDNKTGKIILVVLLITGIIYPLSIYKERLFNTKFRKIKSGRLAATDVPGIKNLVEYLNEHSSEDDRIFVWGFAPELYVFSSRRPASRYINCNFLTGLIPWTNGEAGIDTSGTIVPGSWEELMADLKENKPLYIIDTSVSNYMGYAKYPIRNFKEILRYLTDGYKFEKQIVTKSGKPVFRVFRRRE